jgi:hypothetical protein
VWVWFVRDEGSEIVRKGAGVANEIRR